MTKMTNKELHKASTWDMFAKGILPSDQRPSPEEAADVVIRLMVKLNDKDEEIRRLEKEVKIANQQFKLFALEVSNMANRHAN